MIELFFDFLGSFVVAVELFFFQRAGTQWFKKNNKLNYQKPFVEVNHH